MLFNQISFVLNIHSTETKFSSMIFQIRIVCINKLAINLLICQTLQLLFLQPEPAQQQNHVPNIQTFISAMNVSVQIKIRTARSVAVYECVVYALDDKKKQIRNEKVS